MDKRPGSIQVIGLGQACFDFLGEIPFYPREDGKVELKEMHFQCGGPVSTALVTLSRLGIPTSFIGSISDDYFGREILKGLQKEKVDTTFLKITPGHTSQFAFIAVTEASGSRNVFWHRGSTTFLEPFEVDLSRFQDAKILHLDGLMIRASIEAARQAREMGIKIVYDAGTMREGSMELVRMVDVLIASEGFADPLMNHADTSPERALEELARICTGDVVITLGSRGSAGYFRKNVIFQKAFPVEAVDTTGAGDVFHGAYIYGLLEGWSMPECMRFASATSALKCKKMGARKGIPGLDDIKKFMDNHSIL